MKKPPLDPTFFTDRDLGKSVPKILRDAGLSVERFDDHFDPNTPDTEWLAKLKSKDWYVVTHDKKIQKRPHERQAVIDSGIGLFILVGNNTTHQVLADNFVDIRHKVIRFIENHPRPFIAKVYKPSPSEKSGRIELKYP